MLAVAILCITIALMLATALSRAAVVQQRQSRNGTYQQQALWLAESGLQRAVFRLRTAPGYAGETWDVPADALGSAHAGVVTIEVQPNAAGDGRIELQVTARYPVEQPTGAMHVRSIVLPAVQGSESTTNN